MKSFSDKQICRIITIAWLTIVALTGAATADNDYDPTKILQVPHQSILNNETLPSTAGNTGAMRFAIPIEVAPGRNGLQPDLALSYNSSNKQNSWVGTGWSLDLGSIQRSSKQRIKFNTTDAFTYNESTDLVSRSQWGPGWYGARIEGDFTKFHFLSETSGWEVLTPDGRIYSYGTDANSRIQTTAGVFKWLLSEVADANGNSMTISYDHRGESGIYPQTITYAPSGTRVVFTTEARTDIYPVYAYHTKINITRRLAEIQSYGSGSQAHRYVLGYGYSAHSERLQLNSIREYGSSSSTDFPATAFTYQPGITVDFNSSARTLSANIPNEMGMTHSADINGDGFTDLIKFQLTTMRVDVHLWSQSSNTFGSAKTSTLQSATNPGGIHFGDINGDGRADCVIAQNSTSVSARAYLGDSNGGLTYVGQVVTLNANTDSGRTQLADVDGDGLPDLIEFPFTGGALVHLADGTGRFSATTKDTSLCQINDKGRVFMADVNGDRLADVIQTNAMNYYAYVHLADSTGHFDTTCISTNLGYATDPGNVDFADINGDGLSDLVLSPAGSTYVYTYLSNGNGGFQAAVPSSSSQVNYKGYNHFGDVNGDGFDDLVKCDQFGTSARTYLSDGTGAFTDTGKVLSTANAGFAALLDVNGDGWADLVKFQTNISNVYTYLARGIATNAIRPDLLTKIDNGYGVASTIAYRMSTATAGVHKSSSYPYAYLPFVADLTASIVVNDGIDNSSITTTYAYNDARYDAEEKEFLGLFRIVQTNPNNTTLTTTYEVDNYYLKGRPATSLYDDNGSADYVNTAYAWNMDNVIEGAAIWVRPETQNTTLRSGSSTVQSNINFNYRYTDYFGYPYETVQSGNNAANLTTRTTYTRYGDWIWRIDDKLIQLGSTTARHFTYGYDSNGNCTRETRDNNAGANAVTNRQFNSLYGNLDWKEDPNGNRTDYTYTSDNSFVGSKNFEGLTTNYYSYNQWGKPGSMRDENNGTTSFGYDSYGRLTQEDYPGPGVKTIDFYDTARPRYSITRMNGGNDIYQYRDGLDRPLQITERGASGNHRTTRYYYDGAGRKYNTAGPFFTSSYSYPASIPTNYPYQNVGTNFDFLNRPKRIASPQDSSGEAITNISYSGFNRTVTDPDTRPTTEYRDYLGRIYTIGDANSRNTSYAYNGAGDLTSVTDTLGNPTSMPHNWLGQMTVLDDPDLGRWSYTYWPHGEVHTRTDQKGQVITYTYDNRNRLTSKTYSNGESPVTLAYDSATNGNGRLYSVTKGSVTTTYNAYDQMGRVTQKTVTIDGQNYPFGYGYDSVGNLTSMTYPDGYSVIYGYYSDTNLLSTATGSNPTLSVSLSGYTNFAKAGTITYPSTSTSVAYSPRTGRVDTISVPGLMSSNYTYTAAGDVKTIYDNARNLSYVYGYDNLHRLTSEAAVGPFYRPAGRSINLYYDSPDEVHAPSRVVADGQERSLIYEDNGNLTIGYDFSGLGQFPERRLTYNTENMPLTIAYQPQGGSAATTQLTYDGDNRRVKKQSGANSVIYVDETYEIRNGQPVKYVFAGSLRVARIRGSEVHYFHKDHLGSATLVTNAGGMLLESATYEPYGQQRPDCDPKLNNVPYTFTDQEWDSETGLYNYDARLYDPMLGRFLTADSVVQNWHDPQALNRYAYGRNNPLKYNDPDGHIFETIWDIVNAGMDAYSLGSNVWHGNWESAAVDAAGLLVDAGAAIIPFVPGGAGAAIKAARLAEKGADALKSLDKAADVASVARKVDKAGDVADTAKNIPKIVEHPSEKAARRAANRQAGMGKHGGKEQLPDKPLRPGSRSPQGDPGVRAEVRSTDTGRTVHHDPYGTRYDDGSVTPPHYGVDTPDGTTHHTYPTTHDPSKNR